jgi:hypothetical protein
MTYESKHLGKPAPELQMNRLWSMEETAYFLGVSIDTVRTWRRLGRGPRGLRLGKHVKLQTPRRHCMAGDSGGRIAARGDEAAGGSAAAFRRRRNVRSR